MHWRCACLGGCHTSETETSYPLHVWPGQLALLYKYSTATAQNHLAPCAKLKPHAQLNLNCQFAQHSNMP